MRSSRMRMQYVLGASVALAFVLAVPAGAQQTFSTPPGSKQGTKPVSATAIFTTSAGHIHIAVTNNLTNAQMEDVSQNISDLFFTVVGASSANIANAVSNYSPTSTSSTNGSSGTTLTVASKVGTAGSAVATGWTLSGTGGSELHLNDLAGTGHAGPAHTIIGGSGGSYPNVNGSISGNGPHNPFLFGTVVFDFNMSGVTADTKISDVIFSFGTVAGNNVGTLPEPIFYQLGALLSLGGLGLKRLRGKAAA